jgi:hypothetical protein
MEPKLRVLLALNQNLSVIVRNGLIVSIGV